MYKINKIKLTNIRGFKNIELNFNNGKDNPRNRTLIIGTNGTCKTTLLRSIILGLADYQDATALLAENNGIFIRQNAIEATIEIVLIDESNNNETISVFTSIVERGGKDILSKKHVQIGNTRKSSLPFPDKLFVCCYGAGRSVEGPEYGKEYRLIDAVYSLFNYEQPFIGSELTLRRLQDLLGDQKYLNTIKKIVQLMGLDSNHTIEIQKGGGITLTGPNFGEKIPIPAWADGFKLTFNLILDFYAWAMKANNLKQNGSVDGILIIDELDQHLHPNLQANILPNLTKWFPELQIIITSHSALVTLNTDPSELVVLRRKTDEIIVSDKVPDYRGFSVEDLLADEDIYDAPIYSNIVSNNINEYHRLIQKTVKNKEEIEKLSELVKKLKNIQLITLEKDPLFKQLAELQDKLNKVQK